MAAAAGAVTVRTGIQAVGGGHQPIPVLGPPGNQKAASQPPFDIDYIFLNGHVVCPIPQFCPEKPQPGVSAKQTLEKSEGSPTN